MPASTQKHRFCAIGIHKGKLEALMDKFLVLPSAQRNLSKMEILFQNKSIEDALQSAGFSPTEPHVVIVVESETLEHMTELLRDEEVQKLVENAKEFGFQKSASVWAADLQPITGSVLGCRRRYIGIYTTPLHLSAAQFRTEFQSDWVEKWTALPAVESNKVNLELWQQNTAVDEHMHNLGLSRAEPAFVVHGGSQEWDEDP
ncbi:hypothetical protein C8F04DRAFT_1404654 [Mycena alexandri]|uniref:Uncharacterized protein n=1 Tax=Mycena alexandri TaxID=1745969 RepID=A0AAD6S4L5_9AGAR|nr:hypothetical protein C8F04DRAFT_1404654 [Mycena alexandri]